MVWPFTKQYKTYRWLTVIIRLQMICTTSHSSHKHTHSTHMALTHTHTYTIYEIREMKPNF